MEHTQGGERPRGISVLAPQERYMTWWRSGALISTYWKADFHPRHGGLSEAVSRLYFLSEQFIGAISAPGFYLVSDSTSSNPATAVWSGTTVHVPCRASYRNDSSVRHVSGKTKIKLEHQLCRAQTKIR